MLMRKEFAISCRIHATFDLQWLLHRVKMPMRGSFVRYPWIEEIEKWFPEIDPRKIRLIFSQGDINEISAEGVNVVVASYGLFR